MGFQDELIKSLNANGERTAIDGGARKLSYSDLLGLANRLTRLLCGLELEHETIAIRLDDRIDMICSIVGIVNARCIFVPLDGSWPGNRTAAVIRDLRIRYIISDRQVSSAWNVDEGVRVIYWQDLAAAEDTGGPVRYPAYEDGDSLYIYFTSGSTGTPKGIVGRNDSLLQFVQWEITTFGIDCKSRFSQFIAPYFDAFLRDIFVPLLAGGVICIPSPEKDLDSPDNMISWIDEAAISLIHCVPSVFRLFNCDLLSPGHFRQLKYILLSGERMGPSELMGWYKIFGDRIQIVNLYGATETTMIRACYMVRPGDVQLARIPIGKPIAETEMLIAKSGFTPCDTLIPGNLYIISDYITKGYVNAPEQTHEKFIRIPSGPAMGKVAFRTGDVARLLADGNIELLGREDRQIKLRGIRIELDEIENTIIRSGSVKEVVAFKHEGEHGNEQLIAFVVRREGPDAGREGPDADDDWQIGLFDYLKDQLPEYMIPSNIVKVNGFPLLTSGKINFKALLSLLNTTEVIPPAGDIETRLLAVWKEILGEKPVSTEDDFTRVGGNSLNMMKLMARIYKDHRVKISLSELFSHLTIRKQAEFITSASKQYQMIIPPAPAKTAYHPSLAAERLYYNWTLDRESAAYNVTAAWKVGAGFDKEKAGDILRLLIQRHEALRTAFIPEHGKLMQVISDDVVFELEEIKGGSQEVNDLVAQFVRPFDPGKAPLIRAGVLSPEGGKGIFILDIHHIVCDGISQSNIVTDLWRLYNGMDLEPLSVQYKDYAEWEYGFRDTEMYLAQREFWLKTFEGEVPELNLPSIRPDVKERNTEGGNVSFVIDRDRLSPMLAELEEHGVMLSSLLFSVYAVFLAQLTGQQDLIIGTNASGRMQAELEGVVGMFAKTLPIRSRIDLSQSFRAFATEMHHHLIEAYTMQLYDLADILNELNRKRNTPLENFIEVMFVFQDLKKDGALQPDDVFSWFGMEGKTSKFPLSLFVNEENETVTFVLQYLADYFTASDMEFLSGQLQSLLEQVAGDIEMPIGEHISSHDRSGKIGNENITFNF